MFCCQFVQHFMIKNVFFQSSRSFAITNPLERQTRYNQRFLKKSEEGRKRFLKKSKAKAPLVEVPRNPQLATIAEITKASFDRVSMAVAEVAPHLYAKEKTVIQDFPLVHAIVTKLGFRCRMSCADTEKGKPVKDLDVYKSEPTTDKSLLSSRPPIVTIMGHIDHGKTTLLDALRKTKVAEGEAGGITQAVGAFSVNVAGGKNVTFLDTPGHAAFSSMRKRGAQLTDIVVLVVAADDSVMEQTIESIKATKLAGVPLIVAVNKCDLANARMESVLKDLANHDVVAEQIGGDVQAVPISALKGKGLDELVECILLQADLLEVSANNKANFEGVVIESRLEKSIGPVASVVVQQGTLSQGKWLVAGTAMGKVKGLFDESSKKVSCALPSHPVSVFGWKSLPHAGDVVLQVHNEAKAKTVTEWRNQLKEREKEMLDADAISEEREKLKQNYKEIRKSEPHKIKRLYAIQSAVRSSCAKNTDTPELNIVVKADVDGSLEALLDIIDTYDCADQCALNLIDFGIGDIKLTDIEKAHLFKGYIFCFNVEPSTDIKEMAATHDIPIISSKVIYHLINSLKKEITSILLPHDEFNVVGEATVQQLFDFREKKKVHTVAGCRVNSGELQKNMKYILKRAGQTIYEGSVYSLRVNKQDVDSVGNKKECGLILDGDITPFENDTILCGEVVSVPTELTWSPPGF